MNNKKIFETPFVKNKHMKFKITKEFIKECKVLAQVVPSQDDGSIIKLILKENGNHYLYYIISVFTDLPEEHKNKYIEFFFKKIEAKINDKIKDFMSDIICSNLLNIADGAYGNGNYVMKFF